MSASAQVVTFAYDEDVFKKAPELKDGPSDPERIAHCHFIPKV